MKNQNDNNHVGKVLRCKTKYIDLDTKPERNYVVVKNKGKNIVVAKLKSIKIFDENDKNADKALVEINHKRYGLSRRTGVDFQRFHKNRMSNNDLTIDDKDVFYKGKEEFKLGSHDLHNVLEHTGINKKRKKR